VRKPDFPVWCQLPVRIDINNRPGGSLGGFGGRSIDQKKLEEVIMEDSGKAYWSATLGLLTKILIVWFLVSFGAGILFAPALNSIHLGGYPLGFWFAQQGAMYIFIALIFYYRKKMGEIDRQFDVHEE
jgi:putative solute:sodium symporter small subunit